MYPNFGDIWFSGKLGPQQLEYPAYPASYKKIPRRAGQMKSYGLFSSVYMLDT